MVNRELLSEEVQSFISAHVGTDLKRLAFQKNPFENIPFPDILNQIHSKSKAAEKLPTWFSTPGILYPPKISIEQTSSEPAAKYKSTLISGEQVIDLTGGFGVDCYFFSKSFKKVIHCEINAELSHIVKHNMAVLSADNVECRVGDGLEVLQSERKFDLIYIDPSRRNDVKGKVFLLKDCLPNVPQNLKSYFEHSDRILIKTSPMLDISSGFSELRNVAAVHVVAIGNEVKELLWDLRKNHQDPAQIITVNLSADKIQEFRFDFPARSLEFYSEPQSYLYEPNAAILKASAFEEVSRAFNVPKLHKHSHLYTSDSLFQFPGRTFKIREKLLYSKNGMKALIGTKANVTTRNFPETVDVIRKKWKISDGGNVYCFFTTSETEGKIVLICGKIS